MNSWLWSRPRQPAGGANIAARPEFAVFRHHKMPVLSVFRRRQPFRIRSVQIDHQADDRLADEVAAADSEPPNLDQAGQFRRRADLNFAAAVARWTRSSPTRTAVGYLPGASGQDQIEREARLAGARGPADQHRPIADHDRGGVDAGARRRSWRRQPAPRSARRRPSASPSLGRAGAILRPDAPAMGFDDLLGDRQPESGILAKALMRPVGVEALEDALQRVLADSGAVIVDHDFDLRAHAAAGDAHLAAGLGEGLRIRRAGWRPPVRAANRGPAPRSCRSGRGPRNAASTATSWPSLVSLATEVKRRRAGGADRPASCPGAAVRHRGGWHRRCPRSAGRAA